MTEPSATYSPSLKNPRGTAKALKVLFYVYPTAFQAPGGGEVQLLKTKEALERLGVEVKLFDLWKDKLKAHDILHVFGSVKDALSLMESASHVPSVRIALSTICWYSWKSAWGTHSDWKSRGLSLARHAAKTYLPFLPSRRKRMMELAHVLLPNSQSEADQLRGYFKMPSSKIQIVPNGVDASFAEARPEEFIQRYHLKDFILCSGRIEPRKNQLNMIRALKEIDRPIVFIGAPVPHYQDYYAACRREAGPNVHFLGAFEHGSSLLASAYAACDTFILASWLETPGLAALEAGLAGAKIVITNQGATAEYFKDYASYAAPDKPEKIRRTTLETLKKPKNPDLKRHIEQNFLWDRVAERTMAAYQRLFQSHG